MSKGRRRAVPRKWLKRKRRFGAPDLQRILNGLVKMKQSIQSEGDRTGKQKGFPGIPGRLRRQGERARLEGRARGNSAGELPLLLWFALGGGPQDGGKGWGDGQGRGGRGKDDSKAN